MKRCLTEIVNGTLLSGDCSGEGCDKGEYIGDEAVINVCRVRQQGCQEAV